MVPYIGFSRLTKSYGEHCKTRAGFLSRLRMVGLFDPTCHHHALGMIDGSLSELAKLNLEGFDSCDSSAPVWRGVHGYRLGLDREEWPDFPFKPEVQKINHSYDAVDFNVRRVLEVCR